MQCLLCADGCSKGIVCILIYTGPIAAYRGVLLKDSMQYFLLESVPWFCVTFEWFKVQSHQSLHLCRTRSLVRVYEAVQTPGTFTITAPKAYHHGVNLGCNEAEASNYATRTWFCIGQWKLLIPSNRQIQNYVLMPF